MVLWIPELPLVMLKSALSSLNSLNLQPGSSCGDQPVCAAAQRLAWVSLALCVTQLAQAILTTQYWQSEHCPLLHSTCPAGSSSWAATQHRQFVTLSLGRSAAAGVSQPGTLRHSTCPGHTYHSILAVWAAAPRLPGRSRYRRACKASQGQLELASEV